jgi:hypothetical protein
MATKKKERTIMEPDVLEYHEKLLMLKSLKTGKKWTLSTAASALGIQPALLHALLVGRNSGVRSGDLLSKVCKFFDEDQNTFDKNLNGLQSKFRS